MFRGIFGALAALILTTSGAPAASSPTDVPLDQRIANAQAKRRPAPNRRAKSSRSTGQIGIIGTTIIGAITTTDPSGFAI